MFLALRGNSLLSIHYKLSTLSGGVEGLPEGVGGDGGLDVDGLAADGVDEVDAACEQRDAAVGVAALVAVLEVAADGAAYGGELDAYLVLAAGEELDFEEAVAVALGYECVAQAGFLGAGARRGGGVAFVVALRGGDVVGELGLRLGRHSAGDGPVALVDGAGAEHLVEARQGLGCLGENHNAADGAVEAMAHADEDVAGLGVFLLEPGCNGLAEGCVAGLVALHYLAGSLVDDDDVVVFVEYLHKLA